MTMGGVELSPSLWVPQSRRVPELGSSLFSAITGWRAFNKAGMGGPGLGGTQTRCISTMGQREGTSAPSTPSCPGPVRAHPGFPGD